MSLSQTINKDFQQISAQGLFLSEVLAAKVFTLFTIRRDFRHHHLLRTLRKIKTNHYE